MPETGWGSRKWGGGLSLLIHEELEQHITHTENKPPNHENHTSQRASAHANHNPKHICTTPRKTKTEQQEHWTEVQKTVQEIPTKHLTIWCADANGKIGKIRQGEEKPRRIFGPYTKQEKAEKGNGQEISNIRYRENMVPMNTWGKAPLTKEENKQ